MKKSWELFGSCLLNSKFFSYFQHIFLCYLIKNPQTTIAFTFLTHNISDIGGVTRQPKKKTCYNTNANNLQKYHIQRWQDFSINFRFQRTIWTVKSAISGSKSPLQQFLYSRYDTFDSPDCMSKNTTKLLYFKFYRQGDLIKPMDYLMALKENIEGSQKNWIKGQRDLPSIVALFGIPASRPLAAEPPEPRM